MSTPSTDKTFSSTNPQKTTLTSECGHHCGTKDKITRHCNCKECHKGKIAVSG